MSAGGSCTLDASALLALLQRETGSQVVGELLPGAVMSAVNWSEVAQKAIAAGRETRVLRARLEGLGLEVIDLTAPVAEAAAALWPATRSAGLSLGDRVCLALAIERGEPAVTADRAWAELDTTAKVQLIR